MSIFVLALGLGCLWHGLQIVWVAPRPTQFKRDAPEVEIGSPQAFQVFWSDQYAWIGITLSVIGLCAVLWTVIWGQF